MSRKYSSGKFLALPLFFILAAGIGIMGCGEDEVTSPDMEDIITYLSAKEAYLKVWDAIADSFIVYQSMSDSVLAERLFPYKVSITATDGLTASINQGCNGSYPWTFMFVDTLFKSEVDHESVYRNYTTHIDSDGGTFLSSADTLSYENMKAIRFFDFDDWAVDSDEALEMVLEGDVWYDAYGYPYPSHSSLGFALHQLGYNSQGYFDWPDTFYAPFNENWTPVGDTLYIPGEDSLTSIIDSVWTYSALTDTLWLPIDEYTEDDDSFYVTLNRENPAQEVSFSKLNHLLDNEFVNLSDPSAVLHIDTLDLQGNGWHYWQNTDGEYPTTEEIISVDAEYDPGELDWIVPNCYAEDFSKEEGGSTITYWKFKRTDGLKFFNDQDTLVIPTGWVSGAESAEMNEDGDKVYCGDNDYFEEGSFYFDNEVCPCSTVTVQSEYILIWQESNTDTMFAYPSEYSNDPKYDKLFYWIFSEEMKEDGEDFQDGSDYGFAVVDSTLEVYFEDIYIMHEFVLSGEAVWNQDEYPRDVAAVESWMELMDYENITLLDGSDFNADDIAWIIRSEIFDPAGNSLYDGILLDYLKAR